MCVAKNEADLTNVVVYQDLHNKEKIWVRPLAMFTEQVEVDGKRIPRFEAL